MRILVTGGAGFIGSHIVAMYVAAGHEVCVLDDLSRGRRERLPKAAQFVHMDLNAAGLAALVADGGFDCVNHQAAQIDVRVSVADPVRDAQANILGTVRLLEAVRRAGVRRFIFASSGGAIYGAQGVLPYDEDAPRSPQSPYGVSKLAAEHYIDYYRQLAGIDAVVLRYANVYGPGQDPEGEAGVVAVFCRLAQSGAPLRVYGDGEQTRDYVFVADVARANLCALERPGRASDRDRPWAFNISTGRETSVNALAHMIQRAAHTDTAAEYLPARAGEVLRSAINPARAFRGLGWEPQVALPDGIAATLEWFRTVQSCAGADADALLMRAGQS